jgi:hypothetical protein
VDRGEESKVEEFLRKKKRRKQRCFLGVRGTIRTGICLIYQARSFLLLEVGDVLSSFLFENFELFNSSEYSYVEEIAFFFS